VVGCGCGCFVKMSLFKSIVASLDHLEKISRENGAIGDDDDDDEDEDAGYDGGEQRRRRPRNRSSVRDDENEDDDSQAGHDEDDEEDSKGCEAICCSYIDRNKKQLLVFVFSLGVLFTLYLMHGVT